MGPGKRQGFQGLPRREREVQCVRNSSRKEGPRSLDAGPVKGHLPDTDEVMGGTGENGDEWKGDRLWTPTGSRARERWQSRHLGKCRQKFRVLVPTSMSSSIGKEE